MTGIVAVVLGGITFAVGLFILFLGILVMLRNLLLSSITVTGADVGTGGGTGGNANTKGSNFWDFAMKFLDDILKNWKPKAQGGAVLIAAGIILMYVGISVATGMGLVTLPF